MDTSTKLFLEFLLEREAHYSDLAAEYTKMAGICQDHIRFITWLESWGLEVQTDLDYDEDEGKPNRIMWVSTENDPAVGIFGEPLSPFFTEVCLLVEWWKGERENLDTRLEAMFA